jgi:hypothetical protein
MFSKVGRFYEWGLTSEEVEETSIPNLNSPLLQIVLE